MYICHVDGAGCTGEFDSASSAIQSAFVLTGLFLAAQQLEPSIPNWIRLKQTYFLIRLPGRQKVHDRMVSVIKGSDIRKLARDAARSHRRFAIGVIGRRSA